MEKGETRYRTLFESLDVAVTLWKGSVCVDCNPATLRLFGLSSKGEIIGTTLLTFAPRNQPDGSASADMMKWHDEQALAKGLHIFEWQALRRNGELFYMEAHLTTHLVGKERYFQSAAIDITERKRTEALLHDSEERFRAFMDNSPSIAWMKDELGRYVYLNKAYEKRFEVKPTDLLGKTDYELWPRETAELFRKNDVSVLNSGHTIEVVEPAPNLGGGQSFLWNFRFPFSAASGRYVGGVGVDITERQQIEAMLRESEANYRSLFDSSADGIFILDLDGSIIDVNRTAYERLGRTREEMLSLHNISKLVHPLVAARVPELLKEIRERGIFVFESSHLRKDGFTMPVEVNARLLEYKGRKVIFGVARDISDRKQAETELRERQEQLTALSVNLADGMVYQFNAGFDGRLQQFTHISSAVERLHGLKAEDVKKNPLLLYGQVIDEDRTRFEEERARAITSRSKFEVDVRLRMPSGEVRWRRFISSPRIDQKGDWLWDGIELDITEHKLVQEILLDGSQRVAQLGSWEYNVASNVFRCSNEAYRIFGFNPQEGLPSFEVFMEYVHPEDRAAVNEAYFGSMRRGDTYDIEYRILKKPEGEIRFIHAKSDHIKDSTGQIVRSVGIVQDITDRKNAEKELEDAFTEIRQLKEKLEAENVYLVQEIKSEMGFEDIVGESNSFNHILYRASQVAPTNMTVLLRGETGTGKGLIAFAIHKGSNRRERPMIHVNCAALPSNLIESELFGREKGAYTGAGSRQIGRFELADHGTIFLDEIGELSLELQAKLLRVIEEGKFERLGSPHTVTVDVRIIASTNRNLEEDIKRGRFREDLFYRLNVFPIGIPPLREREGDIPRLVRYFIDKFNAKYGKNITKVDRSSMEALQSYPWPGNVRELASVIERAVLVSHATALKLVESFGVSLNMQREMRKSSNLRDVEKTHIMRILEETAWRIEGPMGAAGVLGMNPSTLRTRLRKLGIRRPKGR